MSSYADFVFTLQSTDLKIERDSMVTMRRLRPTTINNDNRASETSIGSNE